MINANGNIAIPVGVSDLRQPQIMQNWQITPVHRQSAKSPVAGRCHLLPAVPRHTDHLRQVRIRRGQHSGCVLVDQRASVRSLAPAQQSATRCALRRANHHPRRCRQGFPRLHATASYWTPPVPNTSNTSTRTQRGKALGVLHFYFRNVNIKTAITMNNQNSINHNEREQCKLLKINILQFVKIKIPKKNAGPPLSSRSSGRPDRPAPRYFLRGDPRVSDSRQLAAAPEPCRRRFVRCESYYTLICMSLVAIWEMGIYISAVCFVYENIEKV